MAIQQLRGASLAEIREAGVRSYASGEDKDPGRVRSVFTNPADPRWPRFRARFFATVAR